MGLSDLGIYITTAAGKIRARGMLGWREHYMLNRYSGFKGGRLLPLSIRILLVPLFLLLARASTRDAGSSELLSFGIHVKAVRI